MCRPISPRADIPQLHPLWILQLHPYPNSTPELGTRQLGTISTPQTLLKSFKTANTKSAYSTLTVPTKTTINLLPWCFLTDGLACHRHSTMDFLFLRDTWLYTSFTTISFLPMCLTKPNENKSWVYFHTPRCMPVPKPLNSLGLCWGIKKRSPSYHSWRP